MTLKTKMLCLLLVNVVIEAAPLLHWAPFGH